MQFEFAKTLTMKNTVLMWSHVASRRALKYSWMLRSVYRYSTVQYNTVQYSTVQYNTVQYSTVHTASANERVVFTLRVK